MRYGLLILNSITLSVIVGALLGGANIINTCLIPFAQASATQTSTLTSEETQKSWSIIGTFQASSNLFKAGTYEAKGEADYELIPSINLSDNYTLTARIAVVQQLTGELLTTFDDTSLMFTHSAFTINPSIKYTPGLGVVLPTNYISNLSKSMIATVRLMQQLAFDNPNYENITALYRLTANAGFYRYNTSIPGESNQPFVIKNLLLLGYNLTDKWSVSTTLIQSTGWSYGAAAQSKFDFSEDLNYQLTKELRASIGHSNSGSMYKDNGMDSNLAFFNGETSVIYFSLYYKY